MAIDFAGYEFTQTAACGYTETITIENLPSFVNHNDFARSFTVLTDDYASVADYTATITSTIEVPDDWTQPTQTTFTA